MKKGCFLSLLTWAALAGAYYYVLRGRIDAPADLWVSIGAGFMMAVAVGSIRIAIAAARDMRRVAGATNVADFTAPEPRDGETIVAAGHIRPLGEALRAPFSRSPAVLYRYEMEHDEGVSGGRDQPNKDYSGMAITPSVIDTPRGPVRLLCFPQLEGVEKEAPIDGSAFENARKYIAETQFTDMGFDPAKIYSEVKELLTDDDGQLRKDWHLRDVADMEDETLLEEVIAPGAQVFAIGTWSAAKRGIVPDMANPPRLVVGDAAQAARALRGKFIQSLIAAFLLAVALNGILYAFVKLKAHGSSPVTTSENGRMEREDPRDEQRWTALARATDAATASALIRGGTDVNASDENGQTVLMEQASSGHAGVVKVLIRNGAKLDTVEPRWHTTALAQALNAEQMEVAQILRDAGAKDETVTETTGRKLSSDDPAVRAVFSWLAAVQNEDRDALASLAIHPAGIAKVKFTIWKPARPATARIVSAFGKDDDATVVVRGQVAGGEYVTWTYQLARAGGAWKVASDHWESRLDSSEP